MTRVFRQAAIEAALACLFPPSVAVAAVPITADHGPLDPAEARAVAGAVPARRAEFAAGRLAARRAMVALGYPPASIPMGLDREPVWPAGLEGSIAHTAGVAVAAVRVGRPLGLDIEDDAPIEPELWPVICHPDELANLPSEDRGRLVRQVFSAKEAAYKAQFPLTRSLIGFDMLILQLEDDGFTARFRHAVGGLSVGHELRGRRLLAEGLILTGVMA
jgi:4'-phosphopantetheinyl transferase EntD